MALLTEKQLDLEHAGSYVYLLALVETNGSFKSPVKVGIADNPRRRFTSIQASCPIKIATVLTWPVPRRLLAQRIERVILKEFGKYRLRFGERQLGEWMAIEPVEAVERISVAHAKAMEMVKTMGVGNYQWIYDQVSIVCRKGKRHKSLSSVCLTTGRTAGSL